MKLKYDILPLLGGVYLVLVGDLLWKVTQSYSMWSFKPEIIFIFTSITSYPFFRWHLIPKWQKPPLSFKYWLLLNFILAVTLFGTALLIRLAVA